MKWLGQDGVLLRLGRRTVQHMLQQVHLSKLAADDSHSPRLNCAAQQLQRNAVKLRAPPHLPLVSAKSSGRLLQEGARQQRAQRVSIEANHAQLAFSDSAVCERRECWCGCKVSLGYSTAVWELVNRPDRWHRRHPCRNATPGAPLPSMGPPIKCTHPAPQSCQPQHLGAHTCPCLWMCRHPAEGAACTHKTATFFPQVRT